MKPKLDNFEDLRALLSLKRHEQPPPDYFQDLPQLVLARIHIGAGQEPKSWWQRWCGHFEGRPILVGAYCVAVCGLLLSGLSLSRIAAEEMGSLPLDEEMAGIAAMRFPLTFDKTAWKSHLPGADRLSSLTPVMGMEPALFQFNALQLKAYPAGLVFEGN